jgi:hypothetical protein
MPFSRMNTYFSARLFARICLVAVILSAPSFLASSFFASSVLAQTQPQLQSTSATFLRVFLRDKGPEIFQQGSRLYEQTRSLHSERALRRRAKVLPQNALLSLADAPVYEPYLDSLRRRGAQIALRLRWRNYVVVTGANLQIDSLRRLPFVRAVQSARERLLPQAAEVSESVINLTDRVLASISAEQGKNCGTPDYGNALRQLATVSIPPIHALGISGQGVQIGVMDSGFRWKEQNATRGASILGELDFIQQDSSTSNRNDERRDQDAHGTECLSVVAGYSPPNLIGAAFGSGYFLAKTEDLRYERNLEQDNYAAGLEWLETRGVDIMTASLGYSKFDSTDESSPYSELDGRTTIVTQAVNEASRRGVICVIPAGNDGRNGLRTLNAPADADSAIVVAAIRADSLLPANFSSRGPTGDGRMKPDIAAQGQNVVQAATTGSEYRLGNGTSYSTPIIAGGVALLLSAFPELTPAEVRQLLYSTASQARTPDNVLGYGIANFEAALRLAGGRYGITASPELLAYPLLESERVGVSVFGASAATEAELFVRFAGRLDTMRFSLGNGSRFANLSYSLFNGQAAEMFALVRSGTRTVRIPREGVSRIQPRQTSLPCGINVSLLPLDLPENVRESVFPSPASRSNGTVNFLLAVSEPATLQFTVVSAISQVVSSATVSVSTGINTIPLNISNLGAGVYFLFVNYNNERKTFRFIVQP